MIPSAPLRVSRTGSTSRIHCSRIRSRRSFAAYDILNETVKPGTPAYGIPYPGIYVVDARGMVVSKYFEDDFKERVSTADILARQFGAPVDVGARSSRSQAPSNHHRSQ